MRCEKKQFGEVSNLVSDPELTKRFQDEAMHLVSLMRFKYYQVFNNMEVEDVVSECWKKILSQNISYNSERGAKFETFVHMIVNVVLIDLTRSLNTAKRIPVVWSMDAGTDNDHDESCESTRFDLIVDEVYEENMSVLELVYELKSCIKTFNGMPELQEIVSLYMNGYTSSEVSSMTGISEVKIRRVLKSLKSVIHNRKIGSDKSLGDILYYESQEWDKGSKRKEYLLSISSLIVDSQTKIKLSDIVKGVLKGWSYKRIGESLNIDSSVVQETLTRYETITI